MKITIAILESLFDKLLSALAWDGKERAVVILCRSYGSDARLKLLPEAVVVPEESDYQDRSAGHYKFKREFMDQVLNRAVKNQQDILLSHVHPAGCGARFSGIDYNCEDRFFTSLTEQIQGMRWGSLVFANDRQRFAGHVWSAGNDSPDVFTPVSKIIVLGARGIQVLLPDNHPEAMARNDRPHFSDFIFQRSKEHQRGLLRELTVGLVGCSGTGSPLIEMLARLGVGELLLCDPDKIEEKNLNRLQGVTPRDIGANKAEFYKAYLERVAPDTAVRSFPNSFYDLGTQNAFAQCDAVFGCVDSGARHSLNRLAFANLIIYYDLGVGAGEGKKGLDFLGFQIHRLFPDQPICLKCSGAFAELWAEYLNPPERERSQRQGYVKGAQQAGVFSPPLYFLNAQCAAKAVETFLLDLFPLNSAGRGKNLFKIEWSALERKEYSIFYEPQGENACSVCSPGGALGKGEAIPPLLPEPDESSANAPLVWTVQPAEVDSQADGLLATHLRFLFNLSHNLARKALTKTFALIDKEARKWFP